MPLKLLTWNIEQYGKTRALKDDSVIRNEYVAQVINKLDADIVSLIEIKTKDFDVATKISAMLCKMLLDKYGKKYSYTFTHHNKIEIYVFLYKYEQVTPVVLSSGNRELYSLTELEKQSFVKVTDATKQFTKNTTESLSHYFPLIDYKTEQGRPMGLGLFYDWNTQKYLAFMAWHNLAGDRWGNNKRSKKEMELLAQEDYIKAKTFTLDIDKKKQKITNFIVSGDFNVNMAEDKETYQYFQGYNITNNDNTYLHTYDPEDFYVNSIALRSANFDNFLINCPDGYNQFTVRVEDIPKWIYDNKNVFSDLIKRASLDDETHLTEATVTAAISVFEKQTMTEDFAIPKNQWTSITNKLLKLKIRNDKVNPDSISEVKKIYEDVDSKKEFDTLVKQINKQIASLADVFSHFYNVINNYESLTYTDTLFLTRNVLSDHLPVLLELK
ncbi:MAG: hypothetical protein JNM68_15655 [Dinghuibacter sp.]|nr:hypothetical protein [Dinghuibacter sp.]